MAITYGFFNSVNDDRLYNAETFNTYFEGLISQSGVYKNVGTELIVSPVGGLNISIGTGKAIVNTHWVKLTASESLTLATAHNFFGRYDAITLRWNNSSRDVTLQAVTGTPSSNPQRPQPIRTAETYEIVLAYVMVGKNTTTITPSNIYDQRANNAVCGFITGIIDQVDITELFAEYEARFAALENSLKNYESDARAAFDAWYYDLTQNLTVGGYIVQYRKIVNGAAGLSSTIPLDMEGYTYDENDILLINLNGLMLQPQTDYTIYKNSNPVEVKLWVTQGILSAGNRADIMVLKSNLNQTSGGLLTSESGEKYIYIDDALPGEAHGFIVGTLGTNNEIAVANRNLFRIDQLNSVVVGNVTFTKNANGTITVNCSNSSSAQQIECTIDKNAIQAGQAYILNSGSNSANVKVELTLNYADSTSETIESFEGNTVTINVSKEVTSATGRIITVASGEAINNVIISPQLEYGIVAHEFKNNSYSTFTYTGSNKPILTDSINNIWSNDDAVRDMQIIYVVMGGDTDGDAVLYPI